MSMQDLTHWDWDRLQQQDFLKVWGTFKKSWVDRGTAQCCVQLHWVVTGWTWWTGAPHSVVYSYTGWSLGGQGPSWPPDGLRAVRFQPGVIHHLEIRHPPSGNKADR